MQAMAIDSTYIKAHRSAHPRVVGKPRKST
jgi:hypothetical protein